jgi:ADP-heptose:LPS heptosyltransferase
MKTETRILLIKTHALGDLLLTTPAIHRIRKGLPEAHTTLLTTTQCKPLVVNNPDLNEVITLPGLGVSPHTLTGLLRARSIRADHVVVFQISRAAHAVARWLAAGEVVALKRGSEGIVPWPPPFQTYTADSYQQFVEPLVTNCEPVDSKPRLFITEAEKRELLSDHVPARYGAKSYAVLAPGGGTNLRQSVTEKRWSAQRFAELCDLLEERLGLPSIIVGSQTDLSSANTLARTTVTTPLNLAGKTNLRLLAALLNQAALVVCNDSLVLHMAVALGTPLVGLFGPTSAANFLPGTPGPYTGVSSKSSCSPCYGNSLFPGCKLGTAVCMDEITLDHVFLACEDRLL